MLNRPSSVRFKMWIYIYLSAIFFNLALAACPGDWLSVATNDTNGNPIQTCYKVYSAQRAPFKSAATFCQGQGGYLARDTSDAVHTLLKQVLLDAIKSSTHPSAFWIGLTDNNGTGGPWKWLNGPVLGTYKNFAIQNVTNTPNMMDCVYISAGSLNMKWYVTTKCDQSFSFICQKDADAAPVVVTTLQPLRCPSGFTNFPELHMCVRLITTPLSWTDARTTCKTYGGDLARIANSYVNTYIDSLIYSQKSIYWIGLNDRSNEGKYVWLDETVESNFTNWDTNMPNNQGGNENCVAIDGNKNFKWDDGDCSLPNRFVCQSNPLAGTVPPQASTSASNTNCDSGWISIPNSDSCVQFNTNVLTWMDAVSNCISAGADLAAIEGGLEQIDLVAASETLTSDFFWIGANDRSTQNGWHWVDGSPFAFLNWDDQQPDNSGSSSCAAFARLSGRWDALPCENRHGYMCKKKGKVTLHSLVTTSTTPANLPGDVTFGCPSGWNSFRGSCYIAASFLTGMDWATANSSCSGSQGALATIVDNDENDFITSMIPDNYTGYAWIGLQDPVENTFSWEDGTPVQYTNWGPGQPNNLDSADCVVMSTSNGKWTVVTCDRVIKMYICKKNKYILPFTESNINPGCQNGSLGHGTQCYNFVITARNYNDAENDCKARSAGQGNLVTVYSEHVQDFLTAQLSTLVGKAFWIGLSQIGPTYGWQSHWPVSLTYWGKNHTGNEQSTCVALVQSSTTANWVNYPCTNVMSYICESVRSGYASQAPPITAVTMQLPCPAGWLSHGNGCYNMFGTGLNKLPWAAAQSTCANQAPGGSLATISDNATQAWLLQTVLSSFSTMGTIWIGLNDRDEEGGYAWADNSPFLYSNWAPNEPNNKLDREDCVAWVVGLNNWNDDYCYMPYSYICQVPRGSVIATAGPQFTGFITPQCGNNSWIMFNSGCYYMGPAFGVGELATWFEARQKCLDMSADLVSITSAAENGFLTMMASKININYFWTGLNNLDLETFGWSDFSPITFVSWNANEPNDGYGEERCVEFNSRGLWNDAQCQQKFGYFCKKRPGNFSPVQPSPTDTSGGCPRGFVSLPALSYCYQVGGTTNTTSKNYEDAMKACELMVHKSQLASIHTKLEEKFVLVLAYGLRQPAWIGLNDRRIRNQFEWVDNSVVSYTNWGPNQPNENLNDNSPGARQDCVDLQIRRNPGTWGDRTCNSTLAYICESKKGSTLPTSTPNTTGCLQGYQRFSNSCYKFVQNPLNWTSAESACKQDGGNLVTLNSGIEQSFAEILVQGAQTDISQIWIGLKYSLVSASFSWADGWPVRYTNWGQNEPKLQKNGYCVTHTIDDHWQVSPCVMELSFVCEINFVTPPPTGATNRPGRCPDSTWSSNNGHCYHIETSAPVTWAQANAACRLLGANLTNIHSDRESRYLTNLIGGVGKDVWIGLYKGQGTGFTWYDGTEAEYFYWAAGEPNDPDSFLHQDCVKILGQYGTWADTDCLDKNAYICEMQQRGRPSLGPNATYPTRSGSNRTRNPNGSRPTRSSGSNRTRNPNGSRPTRNSGSNRTRNPNGSNQSRRPGRRTSSAPGVLAQGGTSNSGLNGGGVAGIIIAMLVLVLISVAVGFAVYRHRQGLSILPERLQSSLPGFSNVSYSNKTGEKVSLSSDALSSDA